MKLPKVIYIMGMPGSGKGTQSEMLSRDVGYKRFSTGNAFRQIALEDTELGRKVKSTINSGLLTDPALAIEVVLNAIGDLIAQGDGIVFDGTPRTIEEAKVINARFLEKGYGTPLLIYLTVDKDTMIERNSKRRLCLNIESEFPVTTTEGEQRCLDLGGIVGIRPDDEKDKFTTRYNQFMELTYPAVLQHRKDYPECFFMIDGMMEPHRVHDSIMDIVRQFEV